MRKKFIELLDQYVENTNKSIFDLDLVYLEKNGYPNIREIKREERLKIYEDSFYVFNECLKTSQNINQRFVVSVEIKQQRGDRIELTITDNKNNAQYSDQFYWYPLVTKKGFIVPNKIETWLNNTLVELNNGV